MEKSGFFNSVNGDRKYKPTDFAEYFNSFVSNGVFPNPSNNLQVMSSNNMTVILSPGKAWINGYIYINTTDLIQAVDVADGALNRIDRLVLKFDTLNRNIKAVIKKGAFASSPVAPSLQRDADAYELGIADIYIAKGATSITQANITDLRLNNDYCGIVNSIMQADTTTLLNQYTQGFETKKTEFEQAFNVWFATIQAALDGDTAGNLLNLINNHKDDNTLHKTANIPMTNYALPAIGGAINATDTINQAIGKLEKNAASHLTDTLYQTAGGTAIAIALTIKGTLTDGYPITFVASADNNGAATTVNTKPLYKPGGTNAPTLKSGKAYSIWYNQVGDCFFIKASATGTVTSDKVLAGETYSTEVDTDQIGTMNIQAENIKKGITYGGITGNKLEFGAGDTLKYSRVYNTNAQILDATLPNTSVYGRRKFLDGGFYQIFVPSNVVLRRYKPDLTIAYDISIATSAYSVMSWDIVKALDGYHYISCVLASGGYYYHKLIKVDPATGAKIWTVDLVGGINTYSTQQMCTAGNYIYVPSLTGVKVQRIDFNGTVTDIVNGLTGMAFIDTDGNYIAVSDGNNIYTYTMEGRNLSGGTQYIAMYSRGSYERFAPLKCKAGFLFTTLVTGGSNELVSINRKQLPNLNQLGSGGPFVLYSSDMTNMFIDDAITLVTTDPNTYYLTVLRTSGYATDVEIRSLSLLSQIYKGYITSELVNFDSANGDIYHIAVGTNKVTRYHVDAKIR